MGWVRSQKRYGACLALAALALQIVLSFGHVHVGRPAGDGHAAFAGAHQKLAQNAPQRPAHNPSNDADDYCAICATIHLASTSFMPLPPQLPVPVAFARIEHAYGATFSVVPPRRVAFRSRAPPAA